MKKIVFANAYSDMKHVFPSPVPVSKNIPNWYKEQASYVGDSKLQNGVYKSTIKKCQAVFDSMSMGYYLLCPVDIHIDSTKDNVEFQVPPSFQFMFAQLVATHSPDQVQSYPIDEDVYSSKGIVRIHPTWMPSTPTGYSVLYTNPSHGDESPLFAISAVVDSDRFIPDGHISFLVKKGFSGVIKKGTPLVQVVPFKRENWEMSIDDEFTLEDLIAQRLVIRSSFLNGYKKLFWSKKIFK